MTATESDEPVVSDRRLRDRRQSTARMLFGSIIVIAVLYTAKQVFIPFALALLFAFLLKPIVSLLERSFLRRTLAIGLVLAVVVMLLGSASWLLMNQAKALAQEVAQYSGNLEKKFSIFRGSQHGTLQVMERTLEKIVASAEPTQKADLRVQVLPEKKTLADRYERYAPTAEGIASAFLVVFLVFFMLQDREQLRDRLLRLAGRAHLTVTTQAIGEAGHRISRYLLTQAALNIMFGTLIGIGLFFLEVPHWLLWAVLAAILRFIPYIGAVLSAGLPTILALAVFPGWYIPLAVLGLFVLIDQLIAGLVEPAVIGQRVGVSPVALLIAAIFWGWLWGPVGLLLATPITVCLTVAGEFVPAMRVFSILFGTESALEDYLSFYNRLLVRDRVGAATLADRFSEEGSMQQTFEDLFVPTLSFAAEELQQKRISRAHDHFIKDTIRDLIVRIGDRNASREPHSGRIVAVSVAAERLSLGTLMLAQLMREQGHPVDIFTDLDPDEVAEYIKEAEPSALFLSCSNADHLVQGMELLGSIRKLFPHLPILATGSAFSADAQRALNAGATLVATSLVGTRDEMLRLLKRRR